MTESVKHVIWLENLGRADVARVGGKNASLGELVRHLEPSGVRVPERNFATVSTSNVFFDVELQRVWPNELETRSPAGGIDGRGDRDDAKLKQRLG